MLNNGFKVETWSLWNGFVAYEKASKNRSNSNVRQTEKIKTFIILY